jgi:hypothetical protein
LGPLGISLVQLQELILQLFLDTEFNSHGGCLLSLALVSSEGHEFYERLPSPPDIHPWVQENVVPVFNKEPISRPSFTKKFGSFLRRFSSVEIYADWPTDLQHFFDCLVDGPGHRIMTPTISAHLVYGLGDTAKVSHIPHNALADAYALQFLWLAKKKQDDIAANIPRNPLGPGPARLIDEEGPADNLS